MNRITKNSCTLVLLTVVSGCISTPPTTHEEQTMHTNQPTEVTTQSGLRYTIITEGDAQAPVAHAGHKVKVHYTGWLQNPDGTKGTMFDSSHKRNEPFEFPLGQKWVIAGWDEGVEGMRVGETRLLTIPSSLGYGARGAAGVIPPHATLLFEVTLLEIN